MKVLVFIWLILNNQIIFNSDDSNHENPMESKIEYRIENKSQEIYYTWVNFKCMNDNSDIDLQIRRYFKTLHGDFSLEHLFFDNIVFREGFKANMGETFLKRIEPESSFSYYAEAEQNDLQIEKHIFIVSESKLKEVIGSLPNESEVYFKGNTTHIIFE